MPSHKHKPPEAKTATPAPKAIQVALVEDDPWLRQDLARQLNQAHGFKCVGSWGMAEEALKELPGLHSDVVLMDINLPGLNGI